MSWEPMAEGAGACLASLQVVERFGLNYHAVVMHALCFLAVAWVLTRYVFRPALRLVDERRRQAQEADADAARIRAEREATEAARAGILAKANQEAVRIVSATRADAAELAEQERRRLEALRTQMLDQAEAEAAQARERVRTEFRGEIADLVVAAAAELARGHLSAETKARLQQEAVAEVAAAWRAPAAVPAKEPRR